MMIFAPVRRAIRPAFLFIISVCIITFQSCKHKRSEMAVALFKKTHNIVFQDVTPNGFAEIFKKVLADDSVNIPHADFIQYYYDQNNYQPIFVLSHLFNHDLLTETNYYSKAGEHGLNPQLFKPDSIRSLVNKFYTKNGIKTLNEAYYTMAKLEILASSSLLNYSNTLRYGLINPQKIYQRYFLVTKQPDSLSMMHIFHINDIPAYLDSIQPKDPQYVALQKALATGLTARGLSQEETKRILLVNLERLRWQNKPFQNKYVIVNIPDYTLNVMDSGKSVLKMKVCVGEGRNSKNQNTVLAYNDTAREDRPYPHETPLLNSMIHSVEVNPIWNIPNSIANKEIIVEAVKDRFYLANKNINVYKNGKLIRDPENINWTKVTSQNSDYEFKQQPGADNSLGKIKFLFNNKSSVYLHDTPVKSAFNWKIRAVSHGCVRLGDPQGLALSLFGAGDKFDKIVKDMSENNPDPTTIYLPKKVPVFINYFTCWAGEDGDLQFRQDVYGLDIVLYDQLKKYLLPGTD